jgi:glycerophosphoryl diester phosphodiesterase
MNRPKNIAHRGARSLAPENTLAAAEKAVAHAADAWELDVRLTRDREVVVVHDRTLERTSNAARHPQTAPRSPWAVEDFTLDELRTLNFGEWYIRTDPFGQIAAGKVSRQDMIEFYLARMPTLAEALEYSRFYHLKVNVEIKDLGRNGHMELVDRTAAVIEAADMAGQVWVSSFNYDYLMRMKIVAPRIPLGALTDRTLVDPVGFLEDIGAEALHPHWFQTTPRLIETMHRAGFQVNVWTVNDPGLMVKLIQAGADGIITDFPQLLARLES